MLSSALLQPRFDYGCNVWYRTLEKKLKDKLQTAQNKMIRFVLGENNRFHVGFREFEKLNWLKVDKRVEYFTYLQMYDIHHNSAPEYMTSMFQKRVFRQNSFRSNMRTFLLPSVKSNERNGFRFNGARVWNKLPDFIKDSKTKDIFKQKVKKHLMQEMGALERDCFIYY